MKVDTQREKASSLTEEELKLVANFAASRIDRALALVQLAELKGVELETILPDPGGGET